MSESIDRQKRRTGRIKLLAVLAIFIVPFVAATYMHQHYRGGAEVNISSNGELITPAIPLAEFSLQNAIDEQSIDHQWAKKFWSLIYVTTGNCDAICEQNIYHMRQIHISLGKESHRLRRLVVASEPQSVKTFIGVEYPQLFVASPKAGSSNTLEQQIKEAVSALPEQPDSLYLVDPLGNLMMRFSPTLNPKSVLKDIKRVLRASRIG